CCCCCDDDGEPPRDDDDDGACGTGCCITIAFDVDLAPTVVADDLPIPAMLPCGWPVAPRAPPLVREAERRSTCDGGPPRVDRRTALRATTVLLI
ncbi:MAG: hypothetical protein KAI24_01250, partial [Planctomycetes bacterium]|nr:hypothetical protein [Planctomycetota bacterium]